MSEVEETIARIKGHKTVPVILICQTNGKILRSYLPQQEDGKAIADQVAHLTNKARNTIRDMDPNNDLTFMRVKSKGYEIMVAPDKDHLLIVFQGYKGDKKDDDQA